MKLYRGLKSADFSLFDKAIVRKHGNLWDQVLKVREDGDFRCLIYFDNFWGVKGNTPLRCIGVGNTKQCEARNIRFIICNQ